MKALERDLDRQKHGTGQMLARHEQLVKEMEGQKHHSGYYQLQIESLKRELADALVSFPHLSQCFFDGWIQTLQKLFHDV